MNIGLSVDCVAGQLIIVDLSNNRIRSIQSSDFASLTAARQLFLANNQIEHIHVDALRATRLLQQLSIQDNRLSELSHLPGLPQFQIRFFGCSILLARAQVLWRIRYPFFTHTCISLLICLVCFVPSSGISFQFYKNISFFVSQPWIFFLFDGEMKLNLKSNKKIYFLVAAVVFS